jgi:hypothetical protein
MPSLPPAHRGQENIDRWRCYVHNSPGNISPRQIENASGHLARDGAKAIQIGFVARRAALQANATRAGLVDASVPAGVRSSTPTRGLARFWSVPVQWQS